MKTVVISGYYGYGNIGDEALLASIITALRAEIPDLHIIVLSAKPAQTAAQYGVEAADRLSLLAIYRALKRADLLISGGGSLLQDVTGPLTIPYYLSIVAMARLLGRPVMFYAQGIGPVNKALGRMLIRMVADKVDMITLRDAASGDLLREIGVQNPPVELTADPVFGISLDGPANPADLYGNLGLPVPDRPVVGIFVREWQGRGDYKQAVAGLADSLCANNRQVVFIPMQYPGDSSPAREIAGMMRNRPLSVEQGLSFNQITGLVRSMDFIIGMRLHALIIAAVCEVPMVGISYDPKVSEFLEAVGQPVIKDLESITAQELIHKAEEIISQRENIRQQLAGIKSDLRRKALRNSRLAVELLNRKVK